MANTANILLMALFICNEFYFGTAKKHNCKKLLGELGNTQHLYVHCATTHAVPVKVCTACKEQYTAMDKAYNIVRQNCTDKYFNHDRINVVETIQKMLLGLWEKAFCDDCFNSDNSETFENKSYALQTCLHENKGSECASCISQYQDLNSFYVSIDEHNNGKVCFDLQDAMNVTRVLWSKTLNCCKRELRMTGFAIAASCLGALPVIFYIGAVVLTRRREINQPILHVNETATNQTHPEEPAAPAAQATTSIEQNVETMPKRTLFEDNDNDSDDSILPHVDKVT